MLQNKQIDCSVHGLNFNIHTKAHMARAAQEGIVFAFKYGMDIMNEMGIDIQVIRAGNANLFLSRSSGMLGGRDGYGDRIV